MEQIIQNLLPPPPSLPEGFAMLDSQHLTPEVRIQDLPNTILPRSKKYPKLAKKCKILTTEEIELVGMSPDFLQSMYPDPMERKIIMKKRTLLRCRIHGRTYKQKHKEILREKQKKYYNEKKQLRILDLQIQKEAEIQENERKMQYEANPEIRIRELLAEPMPEIIPALMKIY